MIVIIAQLSQDSDDEICCDEISDDEISADEISGNPLTQDYQKFRRRKFRRRWLRSMKRRFFFNLLGIVLLLSHNNYR